MTATKYISPSVEDSNDLPTVVAKLLDDTRAGGESTVGPDASEQSETCDNDNHTRGKRGFARSVEFHSDGASVTYTNGKSENSRFQHWSIGSSSPATIFVTFKPNKNEVDVRESYLFIPDLTTEDSPFPPTRGDLYPLSDLKNVSGGLFEDGGSMAWGGFVPEQVTDGEHTDHPSGKSEFYITYGKLESWSGGFPERHLPADTGWRRGRQGYVNIP